MKGKICSISWCSGPSLAQGLCKKHYRMSRRKGSAIRLTHPDVIGVLDSGLKILKFAETLVLKLHKMNGHKFEFELCQVGSCKEHHELSTLFSSKEDVQNDSSSTTTQDA